ncbi:glycosyl transferase [Faecalicatena acetigenes]|uniref:Glycosyl transferase n=2 Tax=Lachnospirales TaxID=3085636 RepID=A0ABT2TBT2_9FIRM|nr:MULTISPECIES: glycosyltransferase [Lachnospiraceae]MCU6747281.1 glycosyl transferase [Faecalicatena acetigenes]
MMNVLILSCNTGEGHNYAGKALKECILSHGDNAELVDIMLLAGKRISRLVGGSYIGIVTHAPRLFQLLYKAGTLVSSKKRKSPVYYANTLLAERLKKYLDSHPCDVIVTVHLFAAETLTYMKQKGMLKQKVVAVETDYTCIPFWEETNCDAYIIPHASLAEEFTKKGIPAHKLKPYGIPVRKAFAGVGSKNHARKICRIPENAHVYLIMSGSMGFGKIPFFVAELLKTLSANEYIIVICGNNKKLRKILQKSFQNQENIRILGYTEHISAYMDASDVLFTKPGGLTSTEAAVKEIPIVHTRPIPGCETRNLEFFTAHGLSLTSRRFHGQICAGQNLLRDEELKHAMCAAQKRTIAKDAAQKTYQLLREFTEAAGGSHV